MWPGFPPPLTPDLRRYRLGGCEHRLVDALGAALWGLQLAVTQGLLGATVADAAPGRLRGTAFGIYDVAIGAGTFVASAGAGALWAAGGPALAFGISACVATVAALTLAVRGRKLPDWRISDRSEARTGHLTPPE